jgi:hypothetical protein
VRDRFARARVLALVAFALALAAPNAARARSFVSPPGSFDSRVTVGELCTLGFARRHRRVPYRVRDAVYNRYGLWRGFRRGYVIDHLIPLELGGRNDLANLWPQPRAQSYRKDRDENRLHDAVCTGSESLADARAEIVRIWRR